MKVYKPLSRLVNLFLPNLEVIVAKTKICVWIYLPPPSQHTHLFLLYISIFKSWRERSLFSKHFVLVDRARLLHVAVRQFSSEHILRCVLFTITGLPYKHFYRLHLKRYKASEISHWLLSLSQLELEQNTGSMTTCGTSQSSV